MASNDVASIHFPYCLQQLEDKSWILLNRDYKPIGYGTSHVASYEEVEPAARISRLTAGQIEKLSCAGKRGFEGHVYLYDDNCIPTENAKSLDEYLKKLSILLKLRAGRK